MGEKAVYISTRIDVDTLYKQVPWLSKFLPMENVLDATLDKFGKLRSISVEEGEYTIIKRKIIFKDESSFYNNLKKIDVGLIIIDTIEGVLSQVNIALSDVFDFARKENINLVLITENSNREAEYMSDGIIELSIDFIEGRLIRKIQLWKLRGVPIYKPIYCFTLKDAFYKALKFPTGSSKINLKFEIFSSGNLKMFECYSTGVESLDEILGGGYRKGSTILMEISEDLPVFRDNFYLLPMANFSAQGGYSIIIPPHHLDFERIKDILLKYIKEKEIFESKVMVLDVDKFSPREFMDKLVELDKSISSKKMPLLMVVDLCHLEHLGDKLVFDFLERFIPTIKKENNLLILLAHPHLKHIKEYGALANAHLKFINYNGNPILYGVKPRTIAYGIEIIEGKIELLQII
jgi:KaiC/GvpD/RAD55 family RecA-like ATPase